MDTTDAAMAAITEVAEDVYRELGPGHAEAPYQKAMEVGLRLRGVKVEPQKVMEIRYAGHYVGECNVDILVSDCIAVELKAVGMPIGAPEVQQLTKYMSLLGVDTGVIVNFAQVGRAKSADAPNDKPEVMTVRR